MFYVYALQSIKDSRFYIGFTSQHPDKRLEGHNKGNTNSTKKCRPFKLLYYEAHTNKKDAGRREKYFKTSKGKSTLKQLLRTALKDSFLAN